MIDTLRFELSFINFLREYNILESSRGNENLTLTIDRDLAKLLSMCHQEIGGIRPIHDRRICGVRLKVVQSIWDYC